MGKHNGKARRTGLKVGQALTNSVKKGGGRGGGSEAAQRHTTEFGDGRDMKSVVERNDLDELMAMADLADRDFTADRHNVVVMPAVRHAHVEKAQRVEADKRLAPRLRIPRRPAWTRDMTAEQLHAQEKQAFLDWRRELARLEEEESLVLTPFEKNLEVWRQLWRVLERSDIIVQVVDARDPLLYRNQDLEAYAREIHPSKASLLLLNKADLLPRSVRRAWAAYFKAQGIDFVFWSAMKATQQQELAKKLGVPVGQTAAATAAVDRNEVDDDDGCADELAGAAQKGAKVTADDIRVLDVDELLSVFEDRARRAVADAAAAAAADADSSTDASDDDESTTADGVDNDSDAASDDESLGTAQSKRFMIGLVGYPNVGKSSTINALFGAKKVAVAATPGKTKHFQTLLVSDTVCLCDCPGLVMPKYANSKAELVAAGVIPIDHLTDVRGPVEVVASRIHRHVLESTLGVRLPASMSEDSNNNQHAAAAQLLRSYALQRGWTAASGLPDETRAGRVILKDYTSGKLVHCELPPGTNPAIPSSKAHSAPHSLAPSSQSAAPHAPSSANTAVLGSAVDANNNASHAQTAALMHTTQVDQPAVCVDDTATSSNDSASSNGAERGLNGQQPPVSLPSAGVAEDGHANVQQIDDADLDLLATLSIKPQSAKAKRPDYKMQKKPARTKGDRGRSVGQQQGDAQYDGAAFVTGKRGGLVRVAGYS